MSPISALLDFLASPLFVSAQSLKADTPLISAAAIPRSMHSVAFTCVFDHLANRVLSETVATGKTSCSNSQHHPLSIFH